MLLAQGLDPAVVAGMVLDAIGTGRFWIVTHPEYLPAIRSAPPASWPTVRRTDRLLDDQRGHHPEHPGVRLDVVEDVAVPDPRAGPGGLEQHGVALAR